MKYQKFPKIALPDRTWPDGEITEAPVWCSVDLRDGNQALINPMDIDKKVRFFNLLVQMGFKEIEIGFPSASETEFAFCRYLIEEGLIPDDVTISILTQAREHLIARSAEALEGAKSVIVHLYNSTSTMQREIVFGKSQREIVDIALQGVAWVKRYFRNFEGRVRLEYSPESFTQTELPFAAEICNAVVDAWDPHEEERVIINLPSTVESATPNIYADQIEWMCRHLKRREQVLVSLHAHNDRGTAVAATELALMAGADRVEGTLLGNGERTGNVDIVTLGLNMLTQGVDPKLDFSDVDKIVEVVEACNEIKTHPRHPYVGALVYTAFSGSHQDAIKKGMERQKEGAKWYVPYLPIDPKDVGRSYESIIRVNSQSGKGGVSYILERVYGYKIPRQMQPAVASAVQRVSDAEGGVLSEDKIAEIFRREFLNKTAPLKLEAVRIAIADQKAVLSAKLLREGRLHEVYAQGGGVIEALSRILHEEGIDFEVVYYHEDALSRGSDASAVAYFGIRKAGKTYFGAGEAENITYASINALLSACNIALGA
ncbi:MAG: 2-isopropylmalate synthase [Sulfurospirillum sp.]|nr:MAG: 2-isopropylmalate synthase [Sulfurospirillum sp.]